MVTIQSPVTRVLTVVDPEDVSQPRPDEARIGEGEDTVPVAEPCEACGCQWLCNPDLIHPDGTAECAFCGMWRGSIHRDASLNEFRDEDPNPSESDRTIEYNWAGGGPAVGVDELVKRARWLVLVDPSRSFVDAFDVLARLPPYLRHRYLKRHSEDLNEGVDSE